MADQAQIDAWLEEGLRFYSQGDPARALEAWYRILDVDSGHQLAQQYVQYVRQVYRLDAHPSAAAVPPSTQAPATSPAIIAPTEQDMAPPAPVAEAERQPEEKTEKRSRFGHDSSSASWSEIVDSAFDVVVDDTPSPPKQLPKMAPHDPWSPQGRKQSIANATTPAGAMGAPKTDPDDNMPSPPHTPATAPNIAAISGESTIPGFKSPPHPVASPVQPSSPPGQPSSAPGQPSSAPAQPSSAPVPSADWKPPPDPWGSVAARSPTPGATMPRAGTPGGVENPWGPRGASWPPVGATVPVPPPAQPAPPQQPPTFDPWRGDTIPPTRLPVQATPDLELPPPAPTPPPIEVDVDFGASVPPRPQSSVTMEELTIDDVADTAPPQPAAPKTPPVPSWKANAKDEVGFGVHRMVSAGRVDMGEPGTPAPSPAPAAPSQPVGGPVEERVARPSRRFGEDFERPQAAPPKPNVVVDPWDELGGAGALDLDKQQAPSPFNDLLAAPASTATPTTRQPEEAPAPPPVPEDECESLMRGARELFELGDFSGSLDLVEKVLKINPEHDGARAYMQRNESTLLKMYESKLGGLARTPRQLMPPDEVIWMNMHHKAGFILSQVDGMLTYEDILEISGMPRFDTMRILHELVSQGIIG